jgi:hypothetical protein
VRARTYAPLACSKGVPTQPGALAGWNEMNMFGADPDSVFDALIPVLLVPPDPDSGHKQTVLHRFQYAEKKTGIDSIPEKREKLRQVRR